MVSSSSLTIDDRKIPKEQQQQTLLMKQNAKKRKNEKTNCLCFQIICLDTNLNTGTSNV